MTTQKDIFICHNRADKPWARELCARIEAEEWNGRKLSVFLDEWDIDIGDNIIVKINAALEGSRFVALLLTPEMLASDWCTAEFTGVLSADPINRTGKIIPIRLRDHHKLTNERLRVPPFLASLNHLDFREDSEFERSFARLLAKLRGEAPPRGRAVRPSATAPKPLSPGLPNRREDPDEIREPLLSNLLPVRQLPTSIWSALSPLKTKHELPPRQDLPPFVLKDRLYAFTDITRTNSPLAPWIVEGTQKQHALVEWRNDEDRWRWVIELLNQALRQHLWPEVGFHPERRKFFFRRQGDSSVKLRWGSGTERTVARAPDKEGGYWVHQAARISFETLGAGLYLSIDPTYLFTTDGFALVPRDSAGPLAMQWGGKERNGTILRHVLMWSDVLAKGGRDAVIAAGDQTTTIGRLPIAVEVPIGLSDDHVRVGALMQFQRSELNLKALPKSAFGFVLGAATDNDADDKENDGDE